MRKPDSWFVEQLIKLGACEDAIKYARTKRTFPAAWNACEVRAWMSWLIDMTGLAKHSSFARCFCQKDADTLRRRFPADRVAKALRKVA